MCLKYVFIFQLEFTGTRGSSYRGDMALDAFSTQDGACSGKFIMNLKAFIGPKMNEMLQLTNQLIFNTEID